ncbi:MAG: hypothetical protein QOE14_2954 [Humisphaera sp.]|nr:hypothetical protein [Humisphaera sp.]
MTMKNKSRYALIVAAAAAAAGSLVSPVASANVAKLTSSKDNTLYKSLTGSLSNGAGDAFFAGTTAGSEPRRGLIAFDLQAGLPSNAVINSASVTLTSIRALGTSTVTLQRALKDWGEGTSDAGPTGGGGDVATTGDATWLHTFYNTAFWTTPGGDFSATVSASASMSTGAANFSGSQLLADVQGWHGNPSTNFGWAVIGNEASAGTAKRIASHENEDEDARPLLTVDYSASTWKTASGVWSAGANWNFGVPNAVGAEANFSFAIAGSPGAGIPVTIDGPKTLAVLNFDSANSYTLSGSALTLNRAAGRNAINVKNGSHHVAAALSLNRSTDITVNPGAALAVTGALTTAAGVSIDKLGGGTFTANNIRAAGLSVNGGTVAIAPSGGAASGTSKVGALEIAAARFDLGDNKLIIAAADVGISDGANYSGVSGLIQAGFNGGGWDGNGLVTSMPDAAIGLTTLAVAGADETGYADGTFGGQSVAPGSVIVMYTYAGDANLDGFISGDDYSTIDFNVGAGTGGYYNGDFNYDGIVSGDDYSTIDFNYAAQGGVFPTSGMPGLTTVPEPAAVTLLLAPAMCLLRRRRTRRGWPV